MQDDANTTTQNPELLEQIELLMQHLQNISGVIYVGSTARFEELDEEAYTQFLAGIATMNNAAITISAQLQSCLQGVGSLANK